MKLIASRRRLRKTLLSSSALLLKEGYGNLNPKKNWLMNMKKIHKSNTINTPLYGLWYSTGVSNISQCRAALGSTHDIASYMN